MSNLLFFFIGLVLGVVAHAQIASLWFSFVN